MELMLRDMGGRKSRKRKAVGKTAIEKLLKIEEELREVFYHTSDDEQHLAEMRKRVADIEFDENIFKQYFAMSEYAAEEDYAGLFPGHLLTMLAERNLARGKETHVYVDASAYNREIPGWFADCHKADSIILENLDDQNVYGMGSQYVNADIGNLVILNSNKVKLYLGDDTIHRQIIIANSTQMHQLIVQDVQLDQLILHNSEVRDLEIEGTVGMLAIHESPHPYDWYDWDAFGRGLAMQTDLFLHKRLIVRGGRCEKPGNWARIVDSAQYDEMAADRRLYLLDELCSDCGHARRIEIIKEMEKARYRIK